MSESETGVAAPPMLRVVRGEPSAAELAALVAVVASLGTSEGAQPAPERTQWANPAALLRRPLSAGPGAWRASALPR